MFIDPDLLQSDEVWAAAGSRHDVFGIEPHEPVEASEGLVTVVERARRSSQRQLEDGDTRWKRRCADQPVIVGEQGGAELLGERHVHGVGGRHVVSTRPGREDQGCDGRLSEVPSAKAINSASRSVGGDEVGHDRLMPNHAEYFDVEVFRHPELAITRQETSECSPSCGGGDDFSAR